MDYIEKAVARLSVEPIQAFESAEPAGIKDIKYSETRTIPVSQDVLRKNRVLTATSEDKVVQAYKVLRTRVLQRMEQNNWKTLAVTSPRKDEGKSLTSINLAISLAKKLDHTVMLVDLDFRRPSLHRYLAFQPEYGISDVLLGKIPLQEALVNLGIERLVVLPQRGPIEGGSELVSSSKMRELIEELKGRYDSRLIIFDMPPVLFGDEVLSFSSLVDALLLVVADGQTRLDDIDQVGHLLNGANLMGTVLNKAAYAEDSVEYGY